MKKTFIILKFTVLYHIIYYIYAQKVLYESRNSLCNVGGNDYPCTPPVTNIMQAAKVTVSSTCGEMIEENVCSHWKYNVPSGTFNCPTCFKNIFSSDYLTDKHVQVNQTCWFSGPLYNQANLNYVNISVSFNKRFEVYYLALQFCTELPDSIVIHKSSDYGVTWKPWQYYSKECMKSFGIPPTSEYTFNILDSKSLSPTCIDLQQIIKQAQLGQMESVIPFSPTLGRKLNDSLIDWITITNLRITLSTFEDQSNSYFDYGKYFFVKHRRGRDILNMSSLSHFDQSTNKVYYGLSDISVGGRCQCHGHSNKCIMKSDGKISCQCEHNTDGIDCEKCKESFHDVPWSRANRISANSCQRCHCNLHSPYCHFNEKIYMMSNYKSGGECYKCLHNTAGKQCHYCEDGFYRDWSKPLSHETTCLKCKCHGVGSTNSNICDKKSGQCYCKEGVTGRKCDRCQLGYKQTRSIIKPCVKKYDTQMNPVRPHIYDTTLYQNMANTESECKPCDEKRKRIRFKKFCRRNAVFMGTIQSKEVHGKMVRFEIQIKEVWRILDKISQYIYKESVEQYSIPLWISHEDVRCDCPSVYLGRSYLILMKYKTFLYRQREELLLDSRTVMLQWRHSWKIRLQKFQEKASEEKCQRYLLKKTKIKKEKVNRKRIKRIKRSQNLPWLIK